MSMGNAQVASVTDGTAGYWNPAGLVNVPVMEMVELLNPNATPSILGTVRRTTAFQSYRVRFPGPRITA